MNSIFQRTVFWAFDFSGHRASFPGSGFRIHRRRNEKSASIPIGAALGVMYREKTWVARFEQECARVKSACGLDQPHGVRRPGFGNSNVQPRQAEITVSGIHGVPARPG